MRSGSGRVNRHGSCFRKPRPDRRSAFFWGTVKNQCLVILNAWPLYGTPRGNATTHMALCGTPQPGEVIASSTSTTYGRNTHSLVRSSDYRGQPWIIRGRRGCFPQLVCKYDQAFLLQRSSLTPEDHDGHKSLSTQAAESAT